MSLFDQICKQIDISVFYEALWYCLLASDQCRNAALYYLGRRLPSLEHGEGKSISYTALYIASI